MASKSLFSHLFSRMFLVLFGISFALSLAIIPIYKDKLIQMISVQAKTIANTSIAACTEPLYTKNYSEIIAYVTNVLQKTPSIKRIVFTSNEGLKLYITKDTWKTETIGEDQVSDFEDNDDFLLEHIQEGQTNDFSNVFVFSKNVSILGFNWGIISLAISDEEYQSLMNSYLRNVVASSFILLIISVIVLFKISKKLGGQLTSLQQQAIELSNGNLAARTNSEGAISEIKQLSYTFNSMAENIETQSHKLSQMARLVEDTNDAIIIFSAQQKVTFVNQAFLAVTEQPADYYIGMPLTNFLDTLGVKYARQRQMDVELDELVKASGWTTDISLPQIDQEPVHMTMRIEAFDEEEAESASFFIVLTNITHRKQMEVELEMMAYTDKLTKLPNRRFFMNALNNALSEADQKKIEIAVFFLDLDNFKIINDSLGHEAGDEVLTETAHRLKQTLRSDDVICRLGGDEFTVIISAVPNKESLEKLAAQLIEAISKPIDYQNRNLHVGTSIGIVRYPQDGHELQTLIKNADTAMYEAKRAGKSIYRFFTPDMNHQVQQQLEIETLLRKAIDDSEMYMLYQPFVDAKSGEIKGCEALIRWQRNENEQPVSPAVFIPIAEESSLIQKIDKWVFSKVCEQISRWNLDIKVSVNVSGKELKEAGFAKQLLAEVRQNQISPEQIQLEFTEHVLVTENPETLSILNELKAAGFSLAIDDFGVGFSSLSYIAQLPVDVIKIDRSFTSQLPNEMRPSAVVKAIISLSNNLNIQTIAEGVETNEQMNWLADNDCSSLQGYYCYKPMTAECLAATLKENQQKIQAQVDSELLKCRYH